MEKNFSNRFDSAVQEFFDVLGMFFKDKTFFIGRTTDRDFTVLKISDPNLHPFDEGMKIDMKDSLCSHIYWESREPLVIEDTSTYPIAAHQKTAERTKIRAYLGAPIILKDGTMFGSLCAVDTKECQFSEQEVKIIEKIARFLSYVIELENLSVFDALTGVYNRHYLYSYNQQEKLKSKTAILFIDLDDFKEINDTFGHETGDAVLREISRRITENLPENCFVSRFGGDEFIIHLIGYIDQNEVELRAHHILDRIMQPFTWKDHIHQLSASIGISLPSEEDWDIEEVIRRADQAMYRAKQEGKNRFAFA